ncbi:retrotransposon gag protein domain-containing protein [Phthorimaea operculella]|nr:retrotransposon gag protein domain-containing protein [Phthorimaea operculella]
MSQEIKPGYLRKDELEYEVSLRGVEPETTVDKLRSQLRALLKIKPSSTILKSERDIDSEIEIISEKIKTLETELAGTPSSSQLSRLSTLALHLQFRLGRLSSKTESQSEELVDLKERLGEVVLKLVDESNGSDTEKWEDTVEDDPTSVTKNITYVKAANVASLNLKYDGSSCVLVFLERVELRRSRSISAESLFRSAVELFTDNALLWYRGICDSVTCWEELKKELMNEYLSPDYNWRLLNEIQNRTQGQSESFSVYFAIMQNYFKRLLEPLSESQKLQILMRNIRPEYTEHLSLIAIGSLNDLRDKCKLIERNKLKSQFFTEPPKVGANTIASDLAYKPVKPQHVAVAAVSVPTDRMKLFCRRCRVNTHNLICDDTNKKRPFLSVKVGGELVYGLLDSGSDISILGGNSGDSAIPWPHIEARRPCEVVKALDYVSTLDVTMPYVRVPSGSCRWRVGHSCCQEQPS